MAEKIFEKTKLLTDVPMHYCPGCTHGIIHRLICECIEELEMGEHAVGVAPVGCAVFAYNYFNFDSQQAPHGRAPAVATGIKRVLGKESLVFTYQGDGDLAAIGNAEINHAAARGENITTIFINNAIFGMTGGQMAPTSLIGQKTTTSPLGRDAELTGNPMKVCEMLYAHESAYYIERVSAHDTSNIIKTKRAIKKAFEYQKQCRGFSIVEILATCPTNWGKTPLESLDWVKNSMIDVFPLGVFKDGGEKK